MRWITTVATMILVFGLAPMTAAEEEEVLRNEDVIAMHEAGLPASVIVAKINATSAEFDTSVEALVALTEKDIPGEVLTAMTKHGTPEGSAGAAQVTHGGALVVGQRATSQPNVATQFSDPRCPSPGVFVDTGGGSVRELEPSSYSGTKTGGLWKSALTYGAISVKSKAMIQGLDSHNKVSEESPTFYFCFEESESGLSYETSGATTPSQFLLVRLDTNEKEGARILVTGKLNQYRGAYSGPPPKFRVGFDYEKIAPGVYQVTVDDLEPGEYCFFYTGSASAAATYGFANAGGGGKVFDFSYY